MNRTMGYWAGAGVMLLAACGSDLAFEAPTEVLVPRIDGIDVPSLERPTLEQDGPMVQVSAKLITHEDAIPDHYLVVFHADQAPDPEALTRGLAARFGFEPRYIYRSALPGFAAILPQRTLQELLAEPAVRFVEADTPVQANVIQSGATWGIDRIDSTSGTDGQYEYDYDGSGVHAYIIDTGIRQSHSEFSGRIGSGYDAIDYDGNPEDCNGHGTHVAGTVGGTTYGVAKAVTLHGVRVLDCSGSGTTSGVVAGVDWVSANASSPAVANMSLGGGASSSLDLAVSGAVAADVVMVVAAGNSSTDACSSSPAREPDAVTVGSTTNTDTRSSFSNYGSCLDLFAPGSSITSAWYTSDGATNTISGTSMASPHVCGVAALYRDENPSASAATTASAIVSNATSGAVSNAGSGSPNLLVYSLFGGGGGGGGEEPPPEPPPSTSPCTDSACEAYAGSLSGSGDWEAQPNGTYFYSGSGTHYGYLEGPSGTDFDLRLYKWSGWGWRSVASSLSASSSEAIVYSGSSGYYYWRITSYSGSGSYDFWMIRP